MDSHRLITILLLTLNSIASIQCQDYNFYLYGADPYADPYHADKSLLYSHLVSNEKSCDGFCMGKRGKTNHGKKDCRCYNLIPLIVILLIWLGIFIFAVYVQFASENQSTKRVKFSSFILCNKKTAKYIHEIFIQIRYPNEANFNKDFTFDFQFLDSEKLELVQINRVAGYQLAQPYTIVQLTVGRLSQMPKIQYLRCKLNGKEIQSDFKLLVNYMVMYQVKMSGQLCRS